jgi:pimeloyl-ACP methyl ester carboxylesterase
MTAAREVKTVRTDHGTYTIHRDAPNPGLPYLIFLAGGPGFGSAAERLFLSPFLREQVNFLWFDQLGTAEAPAHAPELITWRNLVADVAQLIREEVGAPVHILAHCAGLLTVNELVRSHRELIRGVTVVAPEGSVVGFKTIVRGQIASGRLDLSRLDAALRERLDRFFDSSAAGWSGAEIMLILELYAQTEDWFGFYWRNPQARALFDDLSRESPFAPETFVRLATEHLQQMGRVPPDYSGVPVQLICGEGDPVSVWEEQGPHMKRLIPHAEVTIIPDGHHWPYFERPQETVEALRTFIRKS